VRSAIHNSRNSIHKLFVITTDIALRREREILENLKQITKCEVEIINESEIVDKEIQERLKTKFGDRFGWVLQQLIIVEFVTSTRNKNYPCLQVDADTLIMNKQTWITNSNNQPLMESFERHSSYYIFLRKLGLKVPSNHLTFINHHMLFQPEYLRRIRENLKIEHVSELVDKIVRWADQNDISPICIEYELYAQGMLIFFPEKVKVIKSSNVGVARGAIIPTSIEEMWDKFKEYNSVSLHSYL
jgi:hypothetical protein